VTSPAEKLAAQKGPVAIVAHDAGAANLLAAWLADAGWEEMAFCLAGPALAIFERCCPRMQQLPLKELIAQSRTLISGTGWASTLEHDARLLASHAGCHSVAVIDHWTDYRKRFSRIGIEVLPDVIWVTDADAASLARATFPGLEVVQLRNSYLEHQVASVLRTELPEDARTHNVLYVLEPIRDDWGPLPRPGEFLSLDYFATRLETLGLGDGMRLRLRPHPSDPPGKYNEWIASHPQLRPELDTSPTLEIALSWAGTVAGCQTYAMVVALAAGRRVVCTIPPGMPPCVLPQTGIIRLAHLAA
jgi:hypothetical protein